MVVWRSKRKADDETVLDARSGLLVRWVLLAQGLGVELEGKEQWMAFTPDVALALAEWLDQQHNVLEKAALAQRKRRERKETTQ